MTCKKVSAQEVKAGNIIIDSRDELYQVLCLEEQEDRGGNLLIVKTESLNKRTMGDKVSFYFYYHKFNTETFFINILSF